LRSYDVAIVGGGIVGCACAAEFSRAGLTTVLIEPDVIGGGATAASMGHLALMDDSEAQFALCRYSQLLWQELSATLPPACEYHAAGALWVAADQQEIAEVHRKAAFYASRGVPVQILDELDLREAEPNLRHGLAGGLLLPQDAILYPPPAALFLARAAQSFGAELLIGVCAIDISTSSVRLSNGTRIAAGTIVLANGTLVSQFAPEVSIRPRKGHLVITDRYPKFVRHQLIELGYLKNAHSSDADSVAFNAQPRATGQILLGSSRQYGTEDPAIDARMLNRMLRRAIDYMPALREFSIIRTWTGFRASTPDNLPLIGPCPGRSNVYLAAGHEGLGITTSLGTARLLADIILGRASAIPHVPYAPERVYALAH